MKVTAWAVFASLLVTVLMPPVVADVLGAAPVRAGEPHGHSAAHGVAPAQPGRVPVPAARHPGYLVEARMGWAIS
jgi:hypothetical protein